jgi:hypothetical protein
LQAQGSLVEITRKQYGGIQMTIKGKVMLDYYKPAGNQTYADLIRNTAIKLGFFTWHYFEMMLAMGIGSILFELLVGEIPLSTRYALGIQAGTYLYAGGVALSMMVVMTAWMIVRGHGLRHSAEMAVAMLIPVALVAVVSLVRTDGSVAWFDDNYCSAMCVGMLVAMVIGWEHFTVWNIRAYHRSAHHAHA